MVESGGGINMVNFYKIKMKIYSLILSELCITLINSWRNDVSGWNYDRYKLMNKKKTISFWIASGRWFFDIETNNQRTGYIGLFERHILWHEFNQIRKKINKQKKQLEHENLIKSLGGSSV